MPTLINQEMMREIIIDHYKSPLYKMTPKNVDEYKSIRMDSDSCIDDITIYLKVINGKIAEAVFDGIGCAISTASTDILCGLIKDKTEDEAKYIMDQYLNMIYEREYDADALDELIVFMNTHKQASRIKCATIGVTGISQIFNELSCDNKNESK